jgi:hypothetical protein
MGRLEALDRSSNEVGWKLQRCLVKTLDIWAIMTQTPDIDKAERSQLCVLLFSHTGGERVERGASGCAVAKPRNPCYWLK